MYINKAEFAKQLAEYQRTQCLDTAKSVAEARDEHYHRPPDYLVFEPGDCSARTRNLQQTNTNGYKFQGTMSEFAEAEKMVAGWGPNGNLFVVDARSAAAATPGRVGNPIATARPRKVVL